MANRDEIIACIEQHLEGKMKRGQSAQYWARVIYMKIQNMFVEMHGDHLKNVLSGNFAPEEHDHYEEDPH